MVAKPFVKAAGGKTKLLPIILDILPKKIARYYEPFVGGGAVYFALAESRAIDYTYLSDANKALMYTYSTVKDSVEAIICKLRHPRYSNTEEAYYKVREGNFASSNRVQNAADFIYVNKTGFNGLFRVASNGRFNVPFGYYSNPKICDEDNLRLVSAVLRRTNTRLGAEDFMHPVDCRHDPKKNVWYFDPPYIPRVKGSDFTGYTAKGFTHNDHIRLRDYALRLKREGAFVLLSNSDTPITRALYTKKDWTLKEVQVGRSINADGAKRGKVGELLIW